MLDVNEILLQKQIVKWKLKQRMCFVYFYQLLGSMCTQSWSKYIFWPFTGVSTVFHIVCRKKEKDVKM